MKMFSEALQASQHVIVNVVRGYVQNADRHAAEL